MKRSVTLLCLFLLVPILSQSANYQAEIADLKRAVAQIEADDASGLRSDLISDDADKGAALVWGTATTIRASDYLTGSDHTTAMENAIAAAPVVNVSWADVVPDARPGKAATILVPRDAEWTITRQLDVPGNKSIRFLGEGGPIALG